jgi:hypothetical protein
MFLCSFEQLCTLGASRVSLIPRASTVVYKLCRQLFHMFLFKSIDDANRNATLTVKCSCFNVEILCARSV